jgi:hypothetical protein
MKRAILICPAKLTRSTDLVSRSKLPAFSLKKVLHPVEGTLDLNIELSEVTPVKGGGEGVWKRGERDRWEGMDIRERRMD